MKHATVGGVLDNLEYLMRKIRSAVLPLASMVALLGMTACGGSGGASEVGSDLSQIIEKAVEEGQVNVYSAASDDVNAALVEAFNTEYPDIEVSMTRLSSGDLRGRFASETSIGAQSADAVIVTDALMFTQDPEWFLELSAETTPNLNDVQEKFAEERYVGLVTSPWVATFNTEKISAGPVTWEDLADSEIVSNATLANPETSSDSVLAFYQLLQAEYGDGFLKALGENNSDWFDSSVPAVQKVGAGQVSLAAPGGKAHSQALIEAGAPLEAVVPTPVLAFTNQLGIAAKASNPNAALVFADFMLGDKGQAAFCGDDMYMSVNKGDVEGCVTTPEDARIADPLSAAENRESIIAAFELD